MLQLNSFKKSVYIIIRCTILNIANTKIDSITKNKIVILIKQIGRYSKTTITVFVYRVAFIQILHLIYICYTFIHTYVYAK